MNSQLRPALVVLAALGLITGVLYPLAVTGLAQWWLPSEANGSLVERDGRVVGSRLVGQPFVSAKYFHGRPSATAPHPYNAAASSGSNQGPANDALKEAVAGRVVALRGETRSDAPVPVDLVTASASGLDPHISLAAARWQVERIAAMRGMERGRLEALIEAHARSRLLGLLGEPVVNVLEINLALDALK